MKLCGDLWLVVLVVAAAGCRSALHFTCADDSQCRVGSTQGICVQPDSVCALPAADCSSGYRYDASAGGTLANECVSGNDMAVTQPDDMGTSGGDGGQGPPDMTVVCGHAGQACCGAPFAPCVTGTQCSPTSMSCEANDVWVFGYDVNVNLGTIKPVGMHFDGANWGTPIDLAAVNGGQYGFGIWGNQPSNFWAVGDKGNIFEWAANSWIVCSSSTACPTSGVTTQLESIYGVSAADLWAGGGGSVLHFEGGQWIPRANGLPAAGASGFWGLSSSDLWAVASLQAAHYDGTTWTVDAAQSPVSAIWGSAKNDVWEVGNDLIRHWDGSSWSQSFAVDGQANGDQLGAVHGSASDDVWAVGNVGTTSQAALLHWDGTSWKSTTQPTSTSNPSMVWVASKKQAWVAAGGEIWFWNGSAWSLVPLTPAQTHAWIGIFGSANAGR